MRADPATKRWLSAPQAFARLSILFPERKHDTGA
jgi:hypothetical protein